MSSFESLGLGPEILEAIHQMGFTTPTPIQTQAIPVLLSGTKDFVGLAQTGTGKTAAFGLPAIQLADLNKREVQVLVLSPTRELCLQITEDLKNFSKQLKGFGVTAVYGGSNIMQQIKALKSGPQIVAATPGRLIDLIDRKAIQLNTVKYVVLDEADEMLNMGFRDDLDYILQNTTAREATWLFSATMPSGVKKIASNYMTDPAEISVGERNAGAANIQHFYYQLHASSKFEALKRLVDYNPGMYGIIFTRTKAEAQDITEKLIREGYDIEALHGDLSQQQRDKVMARFREKSLQLLIATDVAARGIDVTGITHVINYTLPDDQEVYTHRSGRTARAGKSGICMSLVTPKDVSRVRQIEKMIKTPIEKAMIPDGQAITERQFLHFLDKIITTEVDHGDYERFLPVIEEKFSEISKEELIKKVASLEFQRFLNYYRNAADLNITDRKNARVEDGTAAGKPAFGGGNYTKLFINLGVKDGFYKASFLQFLLDHSGLRKSDLGRVDIGETRSYVEVDQGLDKQITETFDGAHFHGRRIRVEHTNSSGGFSRGPREGRPPRQGVSNVPQHRHEHKRRDRNKPYR
ncbi:MAG: DEAD/DEAH box helicase [Bacteroidia bacterium]